MTSDQIEQLRKSKTEVAQIAADFIEGVMTSPYYGGYVTLKLTLDSWNREIKDSSIEVNSDKDDKAFDRTLKYFKEMKDYYDQLEFLRTKLTPQQQQSANEEVTSLFERAHLELKEESK